MKELGRVGALMAAACSVAIACGDPSDDDDAGGTSGTVGKGGSTMMGSGGAGAGASQGGTAGKSAGGGAGAAVAGNGQGGSAMNGGSSGSGGTSNGGSGGLSAGGSNTAGAGTGGANVAGTTMGGASTGGASAGGMSGGAGAANGGSSGTNACGTDSCPFETGVASACKLRFMYGVNYAWQNFAADFGGGNNGITATKSTIQTQLQTMSQNGVNVVRWWVWPNFSGGGVTFDGNGTPTGLGGTTVTDLETALTLADQYGIYLMLTLFSFDNFKSSINPSSQNMATLGVDATKRAALVDKVVRPFARAAAQSAHADRVIAWDVINEPEWAVTGASLYGDEAFDPDDTCTPVTHAQMETLLKDVITGLRAESEALVTVGAAAMKWRHAWTKLDQDFYQFHIYDWVQMYWPYDKSPAEYDMDDKPIVMGEFPPTGLSGGITYAKLLDSWYTNGYAGALTWQDASFKITWSEVKAFADAHPCETKY